MQAELCDGGEAGAYGCTATASGEHYLRGPVKLSSADGSVIWKNVVDRERKGSAVLELCLASPRINNQYLTFPQESEHSSSRPILSQHIKI